MLNNKDKLIQYLDSLPMEKLVEEDERYIEYIDSYPHYNYILSLATSLGRINNKYNDLSEDGYSIDKFKHICKDIHEGEYNPEFCASYYSQGVTNWQELCGYHILFLLGRVPGTPSHPGPWHMETIFIIDFLARILNSTILTLDSQPGILTDLKGFPMALQKPYLKIAGPCDRIHRILITLFSAEDEDSKMIKYVPYGVEDATIEDYVNYFHKEDINNYGSIYLGINTPDILTTDYIDYILSNRFFETIARVIENTA